MKPININYAYNGFLYAPLFVAYELGLFPKNMTLQYRNGDIPAIESLARTTDPAQNWFAICDPFAKDISKVQASIGNDQILIVGTLIDRLPVWIYNNDTKFEPVGTETDLIAPENKDLIDCIRCYEKYNTGFLIGERLREKFGFPHSKLKEFRFGQEFSQPLQSDVLVITSDVLKIVNEIDQRNVVFNYPQKSRNLNPFLFTAVLTLRSVIDDHLYSVLAILAGLRTAIALLNHEQPDASIIASLVTRFQTDLPSSPEEQKATVERALMLCAREQIYAEDFDLSRAANAYNIAKGEWGRLFPERKFPEIEKCRDPIPALLLKRHWRTDTGLTAIFAQELGLKPKLNREELSFYNLGLVSLSFVFFLISLFLIIHNFPHLLSLPIEESVYLWGSLAILPVQLCLFVLSAVEALAPTNLIPRWTTSRRRLAWSVEAMFAAIGFQLALIHLSHLR